MFDVEREKHIKLYHKILINNNSYDFRSSSVWTIETIDNNDAENSRGTARGSEANALFIHKREAKRRSLTVYVLGLTNDFGWGAD